MAKPPKPPLPTPKSNQPQISTSNTTNNGIKKASFLYVPWQVYMNDISRTETALLDEPKVIIKKKLNVSVAENGKSELPRSGNGRTWSPFMDRIITYLPTCVIIHSRLSNRRTPKDYKRLKVKALDEYIDKILYGPPIKRLLPVFEKMCRE